MTGALYQEDRDSWPARWRGPPRSGWQRSLPGTPRFLAALGIGM